MAFLWCEKCKCLSPFAGDVSETTPYCGCNTRTRDVTPDVGRVQRGARLLDLKEPLWFNTIQLDILRMASCYQCILGQLYNFYTTGLRFLSLIERDDSDQPFIDQGAAHGFDRYDCEQSFSLLHAIWRMEINRRRLQAEKTFRSENQTEEQQQ